MWKYWISGILGLLVIILPYLGLSNSLHQILMVISGLLIAVFSFWAASEKNRAEPM